MERPEAGAHGPRCKWRSSLSSAHLPKGIRRCQFSVGIPCCFLSFRRRVRVVLEYRIVTGQSQTPRVLP